MTMLPNLPIQQADDAIIRETQAGSIRYALQEAARGNRLALMISIQSFCSLREAERQVITKKILNGRLGLRRAKQLVIAGWVENVVIGMPVKQVRAIEMATEEFGLEERAIKRALKALRKIRGAV